MIAILAAKWQWILGVALFGVFSFLVWDRQALKTDIADQATQIALLQSANQGYVAATDRQNAIIKAEQIAHLEAQRRYDAAVKAANADSKAHEKRESDIMAEKVIGDACIYAHQAFTRHMKARHP